MISDEYIFKLRNLMKLMKFTLNVYVYFIKIVSIAMKFYCKLKRVRAVD